MEKLSTENEAVFLHHGVAVIEEIMPFSIRINNKKNRPFF